MLAIVKSMSLTGLEGCLISVQVDVSSGIPCFDIVGLPDTCLRESKERVQTAIKNAGVQILSKKIIVNLAPASTKKEGSIFDVPIAVGVLIATNYIKNKNLGKILDETIFIGELSLDGNLNKISGVLPICIEAKKLGIKNVILPEENAKEASIVEGIEILPVSHITQILAYLNDNIELRLKTKRIKNTHKATNIDFFEVKGQENVKRALEIAAAGGHNCLLIRISWNRKNNASRKTSNNLT